jgi:pyruvate kinase
VYGGHLKANKGVNFPGVSLGVPTLTPEDKENLRHGLAVGVDWIALSFVRSPKDREVVDEVLSSAKQQIPVMAKIEQPEAVAQLDEIIQAFDGVMIARGDLGVEMRLEEVPLIQKRIIQACNAAGKPVVTATQLLESMVAAPFPTRAEVNDVANAIYDGTDAVMLSSETAVGTYPVKAVETLHAVATTTEEVTTDAGGRRREDLSVEGVSASLSHAACNIARELNFPVIVTMTHTGSTARSVSRFRPRARIVAFSPFISTCRRLQCSWGVTPMLVGEYESTDEMIARAEQLLLEKGFLNPGDYFILTAGVPIGQPGTTNLLKVQRVGQR